MPDLRDRLDALIGQVEPLDARFAKRLQNLAGIVEDPQWLQENATMDLYGAYDPSQLDAASDAIAWPAWLALAEWLRNVLVLLPICLTWWGLYQASANYGRLAEVRGKAPQEPFLLLWEQDFPGVTSGLFSPTFSQVAQIDFAVLSFVLLMTVVVHRHKDYLEARQIRQVLDLKRGLGEVLQEVSERFARARFANSRAGSLLQLESVVQGLVDRLEAERQRMVASSRQRDQELQTIMVQVERVETVLDAATRGAGELKQTLKDVVGQISKSSAEIAAKVGARADRFTAELDQVNVQLAGSVSQLVSSIGQLPEQQKQLIRALETLLPSLAELSNQAQLAGRSLQGAVDELGDSATLLSDRTAASESELRQTRDFVIDLAARLETVTEHLATATGEAGALNAGMAEATRTLSGNAEALSRRVSDHYGVLTSQSTDLIKLLGGSGDAVREAGDQLSRSAETIATRMEQLTSFLLDRGRLNDEFANRLEALTQSLEQAASRADRFAVGVDEALGSVMGLELVLKPLIQDLGHEIDSLHDGILELKQTLSPAARRRPGFLGTWLRRGSAQDQPKMRQGKA